MTHKMKRILGLDLGTTSIGWALVNESEDSTEPSSIIKLGVRISTLTSNERTNFETGKAYETTKNRTLKRGARRNLQRYKLRREQLKQLLIEHQILSENDILSENGPNTTYQTIRLRAKAVSERIELHELARVLLAINKKRGYKSNRKTRSDAEDGSFIDNTDIGTLTPGQYADKLIKTFRLNATTDGSRKKSARLIIPDFHRSDLIAEYKKIYSFQQQFYPEHLTDSLLDTLISSPNNTGKTLQSKANIEATDLTDQTGRKLKGNDKTNASYHYRSKALTEQIDLGILAAILTHIGKAITNSSGYLSNISDHSKALKTGKITIGQYLLNCIENNHHDSLKNIIFYRKDYIDEFNKIWECQSQFYTDILTPDLKKKIEEKTIFYQRRLKSQKGLVATCTLESKKVTINGVEKTIGPKVAPVSSPAFQEFRLLTTINNIKISGKTQAAKEEIAKHTGSSQTTGKEGRTLLPDERQLLYTYLTYLTPSSSKEIEEAKILDLLSLDTELYELNYKKIQGNTTMSDFFKAILETLDKTLTQKEKKTPQNTVKAIKAQFAELGYNPDILEYNALLDNQRKNNLHDLQPSHHLWHLLYSFESDNSDTGDKNLIEKVALLLTRTADPATLSDSDKQIAKLFCKIKFKNDYGHLSTKAIKNILPFLQNGMNYSEACNAYGEQNGIPYRHSASSLTREESDNKEYSNHITPLQKNSLRNPIVEKILNQMIHVVNDIINRYGKIDEIRVELARELKKNAEDRASLSKAMSSNQKENERIKQDIIDHFHFEHVSSNDILRYKLYEELSSNGYKTLYSDAEIKKDDLFSNLYDIEHIIPKSRFFDDSFANKTLELKSVNLEKGNQTALDYIKTKGSKELEDYKKRIDGMKNLSKKKYNYLLMSENEIPTDFLNRDLAQSQYIARKAYEILGQVAPVTATTGAVTARLREDWGLINTLKELNWKKYEAANEVESFTNRDGQIIKQIKDWTKRNDHRHHAMDALTVAFTRPAYINYINNMNAKSDKNGEIYAIEHKYITRNNKNKNVFNAPIPDMRTQARLHLNNILVSIKSNNKVITKHLVETNSPTKKTTTFLTPRAQLHEETIYGKLSDGTYTIRKAVTEYANNKDAVKLREKITNEVIDKHIQQILLNRLKEYNNSPKDAFTNPDQNPIWLNKEKGIAIKRVTIDASVDNLIALHSKTDKDGNTLYHNNQPIGNDYVKPGSNHHVAIYIDSNGNLHERVVTRFEVTHRAIQGLPIIDKTPNEHDDWKFMFSMKINEYFIFPSEDYSFDPSQMSDSELKDPANYAIISPHLFRVQKLSSKYYNFRHHLETLVKDEKIPLKNITWKRITALTDQNLRHMVKVRINHLGDIVAVGED